MLDTTTWDPRGAWARLRVAGSPVAEDLRTPQCVVHPGSHASAGGEAGRFAIREQLYDLTPGFLAEYGARLESWLLETGSGGGPGRYASPWPQSRPCPC